jgi:transposase
MRGNDQNQSPIFSYVSAEERVPSDHPLREILRITNEALSKLSAQFEQSYSRLGRPSIPPERLMRALLLQIFYSIRSERMLMQQLDYNLLFRWFVGMDMDEPVWDATVFSKNRDRLLSGGIAEAFFALVLEQAKRRHWLSNEHFTADGTLLEAWAGLKSYQKKEEPPQQGSGTRGEMLRRDGYVSKTDPEAYLYRKSNVGKFQLGYLGHVLMENQQAFAVAGRVTHATAHGERDAAKEMIQAITGGQRRVTLGADKGYDEANFIADLRRLKVTPHIQQHQNHRRRSHLDGRTTRHPGYDLSLRNRKRIEHIFGWLKTTALMRKVRHRGRAVVEWIFLLALSAYNLVRIQRLTVPAQ